MNTLLGSSISRFCGTIIIVLLIWNILSIVKDIAALVSNSVLYSLKKIIFDRSWHSVLDSSYTIIKSEIMFKILFLIIITMYYWKLTCFPIWFPIVQIQEY